LPTAATRAPVLLMLLLCGAARAQVATDNLEQAPVDRSIATPAEPGSSLGPAIGAASGCVACGVLPDGVAAVGLGVFFVFLDAAAGESACNACFLVGAGVLGGLLPAALASALAGPLVPLGAGLGAAAGALVTERRVWPSLLGALPGLLLGLAGSGLTLAFLTRATDPGETGAEPRFADQPMSVWLLAAGMLGSISAGPVAAAGAAGADMLWGGPSEPSSAPISDR